MFVAPDPNNKVYGPAGYRDFWMPRFWFKPEMRKDKINRLFNVRKEK